MNRILAITTTIVLALGAVPAGVSAAPAGQAAGQKAAAWWDGQWQGTTVSGQPLVLELRSDGQRLTGRLIVGKKSTKILAGKISGLAFAIATEAIDGREVDATGRQVGEAIELTIEGVKEPLTLTRIK